MTKTYMTRRNRKMRCAAVTAGAAMMAVVALPSLASATNANVARLVGDPAMNLLEGSLVRNEGTLFFRSEAISLQLPEDTRRRLEAGGPNDNVVLGIRATDIEIARHDGGDTYKAEVYTFEPFGKYSILTVRLGGTLIKAKIFHAVQVAVEDVLSIRLDGRNAVLFDGATAKAI